MHCLLCRNKIGLWRSLLDRRFCCDDHRRRYPAFSAKAAREMDWTGDDWTDDSGYTGNGRHRAPASRRAPALVGFLAVVGLVLAFFGVRSSSPPPRPSTPTPDSNFAETLRSAIRGRAAIRRTENFKNGLQNWVRTGQETNSWTYSSGFVQPGSLRLWKDSMSLADYNFEFQSQIERKGLGWAYRAKDNRNYYAAKIMISRAGPLPGADIVRYAVIDGKEAGRVRLPLPVPIRPDTVYEVSMAVKGDRFSTMVNGRMVDSWTDKRLKTGGVGLFAEPGEVATVRYASISDRNTIVGRLFSYMQAGYVFPAF